MRKLSWSLLLPIFLLLSQQGELRHEIGHLAQPPATSKKQGPAGKESGQSMPNVYLIKIDNAKVILPKL